MKNKLQIDTNRLTLRKLERNDLSGVFAYRSLRSVSEFQSFNPSSLDDMNTFYNNIAKTIDTPNTWFQLAIILKETNTLIGDIGIHFLDINSQVEIGYTLNPKYQRHGYAFEAVDAIISYLFLNLKKEMVIASVDKHNIRSINLLNKLGFIEETNMTNTNAEYPDDYVYTLKK